MGSENLKKKKGIKCFGNSLIYTRHKNNYEATTSYRSQNTKGCKTKSQMV